LEPLILKLKNYRSIDTYAKELFLKSADGRSHDEYMYLKKVLSRYLKYEQKYHDSEIIDILNQIKKAYTQVTKQEITAIDLFSKFDRTRKSRIDLRYVNFLIDILEGDISKIKIFSWNYDTQLAHACAEIGLAKDSNAQMLLGSECKLNGCIDSKKLSEIKFGWESEDFPAGYDLNDPVSAVVVVGYSFPFANRKIDAELIKKIWNSTKGQQKILPPIYYQIPENFEVQKERLLSLIEFAKSQLPRSRRMDSGMGVRLGYETNEIIHIADKESFYIPPFY
jgi:hypothetical protein